MPSLPKTQKRVDDGRAYDTNGGMALDFAPDAVEVDRGAMSATCVFSTGARDRVGDVMDVSGIHTDNHQRNPVVFWNHAKVLTLPIGKTKDPAGRYTVDIGEDIARQTTYFSQTLLEAEQIFDLISEGIVNANSIGFDTIKAQPIYTGGRKGLHIFESDLLEISWVGVPINQEAVTKAIYSLCCGRPLAPSIRGALEPFVLRRNAWANGAVIEKCFDVRSMLLKAADFEESKHPRADDGKFGSGHGSASDAPDDTEEADDEPDEEEPDEEQDADDEAHNNAAMVGSKLPDKRPDTILGANVELRGEGDYVLSLVTGEPIHADDYDSDLSSGLAQILTNIKKRDDINSLNEELEAIGDSERVFYNGMKPEIVNAEGIDNESLAAINEYASQPNGNNLAAALDLNERLRTDTDFQIVPDGKYDVKLLPAAEVAEYFEDTSHASGLSVSIGAIPEKDRAELATRYNDWLEQNDSMLRLFPDIGDDGPDGTFAVIDTTILDDPEQVAELIADQYDMTEGLEARVEWFNDLMAEHGNGDRLAVNLDEDGDPVIEIADGPETVKGLRFWLAT